ncbi:hypothetical protein F4859DRAFT_77355 [Xylaria cf. heliscus]|nr:hypothetical protein F4859DRAFT_77355 [Xylaria cf. heliscus]
MASLACTSCRGKKQRCDRTLPSCMQCANAQQPCQYPDQNKRCVAIEFKASPVLVSIDFFGRGLPAGFLNALESRLRETELALFYALSELHEGIVERRAYTGLSNSAIGLSSHLSKSDKMEQWANLPLGDRTQATAWFLSHRTAGDPSSPAVQLDVRPRTQSYPAPIAFHAGLSHDDGPPNSQRRVSPFLQSPTSRVPPLTPMASTSNPDSSAGDLGLSTRVQAVVESHRRLYF